jgi:hypothetical protein
MTPGAAAIVNSEGAVAGSSTLTTTSAALVQLPIALGVTGSYANMESFFLSLEKLPRALLVTGWSLCPDGTSGGAASTGSGGVSCTPPATPANKTLPAGTVGGTLSAVVFYAPPAGTTAASTDGTTTTPSTTTPAPSTSTAATPSPTVASSAPAN